MNRRLALATLVACLAATVAAQTYDTLRVASYNLLDYPGTTSVQRDPEFRRVMSGIRPDVLVVQEITSRPGTAEFLNQVMNLYVPGRYDSAAFHDGPDSDSELFFRKDRVVLVSASYIATDLRDIAEYVVQPMSSSEVLRIYSIHLKASSGTANEQQRLAEATVLRTYLNALPAGTHFIIVGDYNIYRSSEPAFQKLIGSEADNDGQSLDPLNLVGTWQDNAAIARYHTQSTRTRSFSGGATGGLDDRFDVLLTSYSLQNRIVSSSYLAYGNDGAHMNDSINRLPNGAVPDSIANALHYASDHLPIVANLLFLSSHLPIQLGSFQASLSASGDYVDLKWTTVSETNNLGFTVQKAGGDGITYSDVPNSFIKGQGTTLVPHGYSYRDVAGVGEWQYRLKQTDLDGAVHYSEVQRIIVERGSGSSTPVAFALAQNYPNPFNPTTVIKYTIGGVRGQGLGASDVRLVVYDMLGREVQVLVHERQKPGSYEVRFDGSGLSSGAYFYRITAGGFVETRRLILLQ